MIAWTDCISDPPTYIDCSFHSDQSVNWEVMEAWVDPDTPLQWTHSSRMMATRKTIVFRYDRGHIRHIRTSHAIHLPGLVPTWKIKAARILLMLILCHRCHIKKRCHLCAMSYWRVFNWFRCFSSDISLTNLQAKRTHFNEQSAFDAIGSISHSLLPVNLLSSLDANVWWILLKVSCSRIAGSNLIIDRGVLFGFRASSLQQYLIMLNTVEGVHCVQKILRVWYPLIIWMILSFMYLSSRNPFARERTWVLVCAQKWPRHLIINSSCPRQA